MTLMTEADWKGCDDPARMIFEFGLCANHSKTRLLLAANCRRGWRLLSETARRAVELAERFADGLVTAQELTAVREDTREEVSYFSVALDHSDQYEQALRISLGIAAFADAAVWPEYRKVEAFFWDCVPDERGPDAHNVRDIFGNPFRPVAFDAAWRTSTATALAQTMYESRDFGAMPILADALQDAGCDSDDILSHCRDPHATHVRGCWVVDLVLGKG